MKGRAALLIGFLSGAMVVGSLIARFFSGGWGKNGDWGVILGFGIAIFVIGSLLVPYFPED